MGIELVKIKVTAKPSEVSTIIRSPFYGVFFQRSSRHFRCLEKDIKGVLVRLFKRQKNLRCIDAGAN